VLLIKENPKMHGKRPESFYSSVTKYPNVHWVHPSTESIDIIKRSELILTLTGTVGIEALAFEKKVIMFGKPPYAIFFKDLIFASDVRELPQLIDKVLRSGKKPSVGQFLLNFAE